MKKYVKCTHCGMPIYFGSIAITHDSYAGIFCDYDCLCKYFEIFEKHILTEELVEEKSPTNKKIPIITIGE